MVGGFGGRPIHNEVAAVPGELAESWAVRLLRANGSEPARYVLDWLLPMAPQVAEATRDESPGPRGFWKGMVGRLLPMAEELGEDPEDVLLGRFAEAQCWPTMTRAEQAAALAGVLRLEPRWLLSSCCFWKRGAKVRVCPECAARDLRERGFLTVPAWAQHPAVRACPEHGAPFVGIDRSALWSQPERGRLRGQGGGAAVRSLSGARASLEDVRAATGRFLDLPVSFGRLVGPAQRAGMVAALLDGAGVPAADVPVAPQDKGAVLSAAEQWLAAQGREADWRVGDVTTWGSGAKRGDAWLLPTVALALGGPPPQRDASSQEWGSWLARVGQPDFDVDPWDGGAVVSATCRISGRRVQGEPSDLCCARPLCHRRAHWCEEFGCPLEDG